MPKETMAKLSSKRHGGERLGLYEIGIQKGESNTPNSQVITYLNLTVRVYRNNIRRKSEFLRGQSNYISTLYSVVEADLNCI